MHCKTSLFPGRISGASRFEPGPRAKSLPERIVAVWQTLGLSQRRFAVRVGVSRNIVIRWERGHHRPRATALERLAAAGRVSVDSLLRGRGMVPPDGTAAHYTRPMKERK
jgi:transcriptional regulator with XRE-family HTH domain